MKQALDLPNISFTLLKGNTQDTRLQTAQSQRNVVQGLFVTAVLKIVSPTIQHTNFNLQHEIDSFCSF